MFISHINKSKKCRLIAAYALVIPTIFMHTHTLATKPTRPIQPTQSTQATPVKTTELTHSTQSAKSTPPAQPNTTAHTILKAGYNTAKALGIGFAGVMLWANQPHLNNINKKNIWVATSSLIAIPALAESIYTSYKENKNKQESQHNTTTKTIVKAIYNVGKASSIAVHASLLYKVIKDFKEEPLMASLSGFLCTTTIAALGESIYNDYKHLKTENNTVATTK